jgi:uncharacterized protein YqeY
MTLQQQIKEQMKEALKAKDQIRLHVLRGLMTSMTNELVTKGKKPDAELNDEEVQEIIAREAKRRKDSIEQFEAGGRQDLADNEKTELEILSSYLPEQLTEDQIEAVVRAQAEKLGITDKSGMGQLMGASMSELKGKADGNAVKTVVEKILN